MNATFDPNSVGMFVWAKLNDDATLASEAFIDQILYTKKTYLSLLELFLEHKEKAIFAFPSVLMKIKLLLL